MDNAFAAPGHWFKGNLHTHSNESDGEPSPQRIADIYAEDGYDFLAVTDHNKLTDPSALDGHGMLLIPGSEINGGRAELGQHYHVVALGLSAAVPCTTDMPVQEIIDAALSVGEACWVAHPSWSSLSYTDLLPLRGHLGIEVYNTTCHRGIGRGESSVQWDELWARGQQPLGLAVDDAHWHYPDALGGWAMVKAEQCTEDAILAAVKEGRFYASNGPSIEAVDITGRTLRIKCSEAQEVRLINPRPGVGMTTCRNGQTGPFTEVQFTVPEAWDMVRVEVVDPTGRKAWTQPFVLI